MKQKFRRKRYLLAAILLLGLGWIFRPYEKPDGSKLVPELQDLREPLLVRTAYWADGGSLGILIQDSEKKQVKFCIPNSFGGEKDEYQRLFVGASHYSMEGAVEAEDANHSKLRLLELMRKIPKKDVDRDRVIATISGRWRDWIVLGYRVVVNGGSYFDW